MNKRLAKFARDTLLEDLMWLSIYDPGCIKVFRQIYSHLDQGATLSSIVQNMHEDKLDWTLVDRSIDNDVQV